MEIIELKHGNSSAQVYAYGATVTSWKQNGREKLFLSSTGNGTFTKFLLVPCPWIPGELIRLSKARWDQGHSRWDTCSFPKFWSVETWASARFCSHFKLVS